MKVRGKILIQKLGKLNFILGVTISSFLTVAFFFLALNEKIVEMKNMYPVNSVSFNKVITLPKKSDYIIKIKYDYKNTGAEIVSLNGKELELKFSRKRKNIVTRYYYLPKEIAKADKNILRIKFFPSNPSNIDLRIRNYIGLTAGRSMAITFKDTAIERKSGLFITITGIIFFIFSLSLWIFLIYLNNRIFNLPPRAIIINNIIAFSPSIIFYLIGSIVSVVGPYSFAVRPGYLFMFLFIVTLIFSITLNLLFLLVLRSYGFQVIFEQNITDKKESIKQYELSSWLARFINWIKSREFSDKCVLFFMFLLFMCAFLLILDMEWLAEQFANIAYFVLVLGVMIKFVKFAREERRN